MEQATVDRVTREMLRDLFLGGDFDARLAAGGEPLLDEFERSHMADVGALVRILALLDVAAVVVAVLAGVRLRGEPRRRGRLLVTAAGVVGAAGLLAAVAFAVAFDAAFLAFHRLFFREGTYLFGPDSNLIRLFPEPFWFEASLAAGVSIVASAATVALLGWRASQDPASEHPAAGVRTS